MKIFYITAKSLPSGREGKNPIFCIEQIRKTRFDIYENAMGGVIEPQIHSTLNIVGGFPTLDKVRETLLEHDVIDVGTEFVEIEK